MYQNLCCLYNAKTVTFFFLLNKSPFYLTYSGRCIFLYHFMEMARF